MLKEIQRPLELRVKEGIPEHCSYMEAINILAALLATNQIKQYDSIITEIQTQLSHIEFLKLLNDLEDITQGHFISTPHLLPPEILYQHKAWFNTKQ